MRFRCPECGVEAEVILEDGEEVVSVYCIKHKGGGGCPHTSRLHEGHPLSGNQSRAGGCP